MSQIRSGNKELQGGYQEVQIGPEKLEIPEVWTVKTVSDVASRFISGGTPDSSNEDYWGGDIPWTTAAVVEGPQFDGEKDFITQKGLEVSSASIVPKGGILFGTRVNVANVGRTSKDIAISQDLTGIALNNDKVDPDFVAWYLLLNQTKIRDRYSQGSTIQGMLTDDLKSLPLILPSLPEQRRIVDILSTVEEQIQQTDDLIEEVKRLKEGLMQDLFRTGIKNDEFSTHRVGPREIEIPTNWKLRTVDNLKSTTTSKKPIRGGPPGGRIKKADRDDKGAKLYVQENVIYNDFERRGDYLSAEKFDELQSAEVDPGDVLITRSGTIGKSEVFPDDAKRGILGSSLIRIKVNEDIIRPKYLSQFLSDSHTAQSQIKAMSHGGTRTGLNNKIVKSIQVPVPPISEQARISDILETVEEKLQQEKQHREGLNQLKRGLMQDLLTGKVRVNPDN